MPRNSVNNARGRTRRGRSTGLYRVSRNFVTPRQLHDRERGFSSQGPFDPPSVVATPWNTIVLAFRSTYSEKGTTPVTMAGLATVLRTQTGLAASQKLLMRFQRVSLWTTVADTVVGATDFALRPADLRTVTPHGRQWLEDVGTTARPAHVHWTWSAVEQNAVFSTDLDGAMTVYVVDHQDNFTCYVHVHVLWRPLGADPVPTYRRLAPFPSTIVASFDDLHLDLGAEELHQ